MNTGSPIADQIGTMHFEGNIIPSSWYRHITWPATGRGRDAGKADRLAIEILADLVYWYRPVLVRDEETGQPIGWRKKFREDKLQRSYAQIEEFFACSKREAIAAVHRLIDLGLVEQEFRTIQLANGTVLNNVQYLAPVPERVAEITYTLAPAASSGPPSPPPDEQPHSPPPAPLPPSADGGSPIQTGEGPTFKRGRVARLNVGGSRVQTREGPTFKRGTNTEITTETTTETTTEITTERENPPAPAENAPQPKPRDSLSQACSDKEPDGAILSDPVAYVEWASGRELAPGARAQVLKTVGTDPSDVALWRETVDLWITSAKPDNLNCALDWFENPNRIYGGPGPLGKEKVRRLRYEDLHELRERSLAFQGVEKSTPVRA